MEFSKTLKLVLRQRGLTTAQLATGVGVSAKTISDWLAGRTPRDLDAVKTCAEFLEVTVHFLLYGVEDPKNSLKSIMDAVEIHSGVYEVTIKKIKT